MQICKGAYHCRVNKLLLSDEMALPSNLHISRVLSVSDSSQENVMNVRGSFYSMVWLINLKDNTINTTQINHLRIVPQDSITG